MASAYPHSRPGASPARPVLDLDGPKLRLALEGLYKAADARGGIEGLANALKLKAAAFHQLMGEGRAARLELSDFEQLVAYMSTVRRRVAKAIEETGWADMRIALAQLLEGAHDTTGADARLARFCAAFPATKDFRFVRDLGAETLHFTLPEHYPQMQRWVWDAKANTGVVREIWHGDNVDAQVIDVADGYETFLVLREELSQFLAGEGVFRDMLWYVDLLQGQIYADYINAQGGAYLKTDFSAAADPLEHTLRILGLDGVDNRTGRSRFKTIDGTAAVVPELKRLS